MAGAVFATAVGGGAYAVGALDQLTPVDQFALAICGAAALGCLGLLGGDRACSIDGWGGGETSDGSGDGGGD
jgi:hypothetical protein